VFTGQNSTNFWWRRIPGWIWCHEYGSLQFKDSCKNYKII